MVARSAAVLLLALLPVVQCSVQLLNKDSRWATDSRWTKEKIEAVKAQAKKDFEAAGDKAQKEATIAKNLKSANPTIAAAAGQQAEKQQVHQPVRASFLQQVHPEHAVAQAQIHSHVRHRHVRHSRYAEMQAQSVAMTDEDVAKTNDAEKRIFEQGREMKRKEAAFHKKLNACRQGDAYCHRRVIKDEIHQQRLRAQPKKKEESSEEQVVDAVGQSMPLLFSGQPAPVQQEPSFLSSAGNAVMTVGPNPIFWAFNLIILVALSYWAYNRHQGMVTEGKETKIGMWSIICCLTCFCCGGLGTPLGLCYPIDEDDTKAAKAEEASEEIRV